MAALHGDGLEGLCKGRTDRIRIAGGADGIERIEAHLHGAAFAPHRHDTYAIGITLAGVQRFGFRGERWQCLPGECHVLHPDELHDGGAGTDDGFRYRMVYLDPALVQQALGGRPLPFVADPIVRAPAGSAAELWDFCGPVDDLARIGLVEAAAALLVAAAGDAGPRPSPLALARIGRVRDRIAASPAVRPTAAELELLSGLDRWTLARQFRAAYGTSPSRFRTMRQLDAVRRQLRRGTAQAQAAVAAGFADQSHMSRQFRRAYGLTPGAWVAAIS